MGFCCSSALMTREVLMMAVAEDGKSHKATLVTKTARLIPFSSYRSQNFRDDPENAMPQVHVNDSAVKKILNII